MSKSIHEKDWQCEYIQKEKEPYRKGMLVTTKFSKPQEKLQMSKT